MSLDSSAQATDAPLSDAAAALEYGIPPKQRFNPFHWMRREPLGALGLALIIIVSVGAAFAPFLNTFPDPREQGLGPPLEGPSADHWFGTDRFGKDVWTRVLHGGRISLKIGVATVLIGTVAGTLVALLTAFTGGAVDFVVGRLVDVIIAIPSILLALVLYTSVGQDLPDLPVLPRQEFVLVIAIASFFMPGTYRIMRGMVLELREQQYVEAARVVGAANFRIMWRHIAPNMAGLMIVITSISLPAAILAEASLSFLGVGVEAGTPSWGADLSGTTRTYFIRGPWLAIFPGLALAITVFGFNVFGDSLRDTLDPRLRGRI